MNVQTDICNPIILSIITPAYNAENFIVTAINSFLSQNVDWAEMIIIDDGSKDNTYEQCKPFLSDKIKYYKTNNLGAGHARNYGIEQAKGNWIGFLDSDDLIANCAFEKIHSILLNSENDIIYCGFCKSDMEMTNISGIVKPESVENILNKMPNLEFWTCLYSRKYLVENKIKFFEYREQDVETAFRFRAFSQTDNIEVHKDIALILHRNNVNSNVNTWNLKTLCKIKALVYLQLFNEYDKSDIDISSNLYKVYLSCYAIFVAHCFKHGIPCSKKAEFKTHLTKLYEGLKYKKTVTLNKRHKMFALVLGLISNPPAIKIFVNLCKKEK